MNQIFPFSKIVHPSTINPCQHRVAVSKGKDLCAIFVRRKVQIMTFKTLPKIAEDMLDMTTHLGKSYLT